MSDDVTYVGEDQEYAPILNLEPGETVKGKLESVHLMQGDYGPTPVLTLQTAEGRQAILVKGNVFKEEMAERKPKPGDELTITYLGKKAPKNNPKGKPYHVFKVLGGQEPEFDWAQFVSPERRADPVGRYADPAEDFSPLPKSSEPSSEQKAESRYGSEVPF